VITNHDLAQKGCHAAALMVLSIMLAVSVSPMAHAALAWYGMT
jgi:hypothetical protein